MTLEGRWNPGLDVNTEVIKSVVSSAMIISTESEVIDNIIEVHEPVLHHNEKDLPVHGAIPKGCDDVKKEMGEVS